MSRSVPYFVSDYESNLFKTRYQDPGNHDEATWEQVFFRVVEAVSSVDLYDPTLDYASDWYDMMSSGAFVPSSPQLWNYGAERRFSRNGSSCFTGRMGDTLKDFRKADSEAEDVYVASGGMGLLLNDVRPRGTKIRHCSEGAMGSMCEGGPAMRIEGTTGYITGSGRARGALMLQQSVWHPDCLEFMLAKRPTSLGFLDDWKANAWAVLGWNQPDVKRRLHAQYAIERFCSHWVFFKEWPSVHDVRDDLFEHGFDGDEAVNFLMEAGVLKVSQGTATPMVTDWSTGGKRREANRDWRLPLQNCNMSMRAPDQFYEAVENDDTWVLHWFSDVPPKNEEHPHTRTDAETGHEMTEYDDGTMFLVSDCMTYVDRVNASDYDDGHYRYGVVVTTWEGLRQNLAPNQNQWRDTNYARFYRTIMSPSIEGFTGPIRAKQLWDMMCENAWNHADPGLVNESTYERYQPVDSMVYGPRLSNPCSEYTNSAGGSCNLGSVNLRWCADQVDTSRFHGYQDWMDIGLSTVGDWKWLRGTEEFIGFLDIVSRISCKALQYISHALEYNEAPVDFIHKMTIEDFRTVGIGMMGLAEAMMRFHVKYDSPCGHRFAAAMMSEIALSSWEESFHLANQGWYKPKGWNQERMESIFGERLSKSGGHYDLSLDHRRRWSNLMVRVARGEYATHTCVTSVAPTGSISQIASWMMTRAVSNGTVQFCHVNGGAEPVFDWGTFRQDSSGQTSVYHDLWYAEEHNGKPWMVTANAVSAEDHIRVQAAVCAFCCMSVSKTINLPNSATVEDVRHAYWLAWKLEVPGTTVYRDMSKPMQVLSTLECPSGECSVDLNWDSARYQTSEVIPTDMMAK